MRRTFVSLTFLLLAGVPLLAQNVTEVQVTPEAVSLRVGQKQALFATAFDQNGNLIPTQRFAFVSSDTAVVRVDGDGAVVGLRVGAAVVRVSAGQRSVSVPVTVVGAAPPARDTAATPAPAPAPAPAQADAPAILQIDPQTVYLLPSENRTLVLKGFHQDGTPAEVPKTTWKSLTPDVATVDANGVVVGLKEGRGIVQASIPGGAAATAPVEVAQGEYAIRPAQLMLAPFEIDTLATVVPTQGDRDLRAGVQWQSTNPTVVRVGPTGIVQALAPGQVEIVATGFFQEQRAVITVHPPVESITFLPRASGGPVVVPLHGTTPFKVEAFAAGSVPVPGVRLHWSVDDTTVAAFDTARSELVARRAGTTTLTLRVRDVAPVTWAIEVIPGGIAIDRRRVGVLPGERFTLRANLVDGQGDSLGTATGLTWATSDINVAVVGNDGVVEATGFGHARLTATTSWGKSDTADVYVSGDLLFSSNRNGPFGIFQLSTRDPLRVVPVIQDSSQNIQPAISPDRTRVAFSSNRSGDYELYAADMDGANLVRITQSTGSDGEPAWTPDGSRILFVSGRTGSPQIFSVKPDGTDLRQLTASGGGNSAPVVAPDGRSVAFISGRDGNDEVYRMGMDGSSQVNLSGSKEREASPQFFPDGDLAYAAEDRRGYQVLRVSTTGAAPEVLSTSQNPITAIALSRDGRLLAIVSGRIIDTRRGRAQFSFSLEPTAGGTVVTIPLVLNEQVVGPSF